MIFISFIVKKQKFFFHNFIYYLRLGAIATFEREMMLERQREGIAKAKERGQYKGRKPTAREKADQVVKLIAEGKTKAAVAKELGIGVASVYRIVRPQN